MRTTSTGEKGVASYPEFYPEADLSRKQGLPGSTAAE